MSENKSEMTTRDYGISSPYKLESNPEFLGFQGVEVTKVDDTKPWKPALEVRTTKADGTIVENMDASTPFFTFKDGKGNEMTVSAEAAGHIDSLHIKGTDPGSVFDEPSLEHLFKDAAEKMPPDIAERPGVSAFSVQMGKNMGKEGVAGLYELVSDGVLTEADVEEAMKLKDEVMRLNLEGSKEDKQAFLDEQSAGKIKFQLVRGDVLVPIVEAPKRSTKELFMVFGPTGDPKKKTLYTAAPGRYMPKHPNTGQHKDAAGNVDMATFKESSEAWFNSAMLSGK